MKPVTTSEHIRLIGDNLDKITESMDILLWAIYNDMMDLIQKDQEECQRQKQIDDDKRVSDFDNIKKGNWWCIVDYGDNHIMLRIGKRNSVIGEDIYHTLDWAPNRNIKNVDDLPRDIWMVYNSVQLTPVPTLRELIIAVRGCY